MARQVRVGRRGQSGAAAVEFALLAPVVVWIVVGLLQYGLFFWSAQGTSNAAREAARRAAVGDLQTCADFRAYVRQRIDALGDENGAVVHRTYANGPGNTNAAVEVGDIVTVTVTFHSVDLNLPLLPFPDNGSMTQSAEARVENVLTVPEVC